MQYPDHHDPRIILPEEHDMSLGDCSAQPRRDVVCRLRGGATSGKREDRLFKPDIVGPGLFQSPSVRRVVPDALDVRHCFGPIDTILH